jgi:plastocyanin
MNRTTVIIIGAVMAVGIAAVVIWMVITNTAPTAPPVNNTPSTSDTSEALPDDAQGGATGEAVLEANVVIEDMSFSPNKVVVKKGGTVTWTNQDGVGHNVVSDNSAPAGGPPKSNPVFSNGETYSFTYNTVGTFTYHCSVHPSMTGTVEVVE